MRLPVAVLAAVLLVPSTASAATYAVTQETDTPAGQSCSPGGPCSLRQAITAAQAEAGGTTITVPAGTYVLTEGALVVTTPVTLAGAAGEARSVIDAGGRSRILEALGGTLTVRSVDLRGGRVTGEEAKGGAVRARVPLTLEDVRATNNTVDGSSVAGASAVGGGAVWVDAGLTIVGGRFAENRTTTTDGGSVAGGAVFVNSFGSPITVTGGTVFTGNAAEGGLVAGGALAAQGGPVTIDGASFTGNVVRGIQLYGAALALAGTTSANVGATSITGNLADAVDGGSVPIGPGIQGSAVASVYGAPLELTSTTVAQNVGRVAVPSVMVAGAVFVNTDRLALRSATVTGNSVVGADAGRYTTSGVLVGGTATLRGSIVAGNTGAPRECLATVASEGGNVLGATFGGSDCTGAPDPSDVVTDDPQLALVPGVAPYLVPLPGSPALERAGTSCPATDQRGLPRPAAGACDAGAVERQPARFVAEGGGPAFGAVAVGTRSPARTVLVRNAGDPGVPALGLAGPHAADFVLGGDCGSTTLALGATCAAELTAAPSAAGARDAELTGVDPALALTVTGAAPAAASGTVRSPVTGVLRCTGRQVALVDLAVRGRTATVRGVAAAALVGRPVRLRIAGRQVGAGVVETDGTFTVRVGLPTADRRQRVTAVVQGRASQAFVLERRVTVTSRTVRGAALRVQGTVAGVRRGTAVRITRQTGCGKPRAVGRARVRAGGRFDVALGLPSARTGLHLYRLVVATGRAATYTLPIAVTPQG